MAWAEPRAGQTSNPPAAHDGTTAAALSSLVEGENSALVNEVLAPLPNFWDIVDYGDQAGEIRYSKMLGWLLNPQENHGLGTTFVQRFVDAVYGESAAPTISPRATVLPREWRSIDILLVDYDAAGTPVLTLVIENKTDTVEHTRSGLGIGQTTWYNWVIRGDFDSIDAAISATELEQAQAARLRRQVRRWRHDGGDYRGVPDEGRYFVYLTPREADLAEDRAFRTHTYAQLEQLLGHTGDDLAARGLHDAEKIVRDFRRSIHRRFSRTLDAQIAALYGEADGEVADDLALLASWFGLGGAPEGGAGTAREGLADGIRAAMNARMSRTVSEMEFRRLVEHVWQRRPRPTLNDTSRFFWGDRRDRTLSKIQLLQLIAGAFVRERSIDSLEEFEREFGAIVRSVVDPNGANPFVGGAILYDPDHYAFTPSAQKRYKAVEIGLREQFGPILFGAGRYRVRWNLGCKSDQAAGRLVHLPVIAYFMALDDPDTYPITEAE